MTYVTLALSIIAIILMAIVLVICVKSKRNGDLSLGEKDLEKIKKSVND